jgi:hypothetical protein
MLFNDIVPTSMQTTLNFTAFENDVVMELTILQANFAKIIQISSRANKL